eukprot:1137655-Pelagomonas_calceolata.AAC.1
MGIWRVSGSTRLQILAVRSVIGFNSTPSEVCMLPLAASNCCPGLVSSHAHVAGQHSVGEAVSSVLLRWTSVRCHACCVTHGVSREKKKENKEWVWLDRE